MIPAPVPSPAPPNITAIIKNKIFRGAEALVSRAVELTGDQGCTPPKYG